jgi:hypothetical protein
MREGVKEVKEVKEVSPLSHEGGVAFEDPLPLWERAGRGALEVGVSKRVFSLLPSPHLYTVAHPDPQEQT